jgi:hypothetical protein
MAFDNPTRNRLNTFVGRARQLITAEFTQKFQSLYGIALTGELTPLSELKHLDEAGLATAALLRARIDYLIRSQPAERDGARVAVARLAREQAFTVLNRLAAVRMAEKRDLIVESVGRGFQSKGFQVFDRVAGKALGDTFQRYRRFLFCLFDELSVDLGVLFDRRSPQALLFPREPALLALFELINAPDLDALWAEDETIGWVYQYYNDQAERKTMREQSSAPRNSRELAVRNQFFTPRYVVEFLTDNTLGRIWYEMARGATKLSEQCRYLVRRPTEIFLGDPKQAYDRAFGRPENGDYSFSAAAQAAYQGDLSKLSDDSGPDSRLVSLAIPPDQFQRISGESYQPMEDDRLGKLMDDVVRGRPNPDASDSLVMWAALSRFTLSDGGGAYSIDPWRKLWAQFLSVARRPTPEATSQEDLLKQPVFIPHRPLKDPRTILMLDPACGSMHFGLYAFDLFEVIYDEAWALEEKLGADALSRPPGMKSLHATYAGKDAFLKDVPRLIIEHNLHGIDIDPRCAQIAGLSLWLRAQKAWQRLGLKPAERPAIKRSNIVCAEPMPGEKELLREFVEREFPAAERAVCLRLLEAIFDKMQLAGEAGSLLKIEEEIRSAIEDARDAWQKLATRPRELFTTTELNQLSTAPELTGLEQAVSSLTTDPRPLTTDFWEHIEERIYAALRDYAEQAENGGGFQRRLFAEDAARGFAFIDVCRKRYDVALMNPPFGLMQEGVFAYLQSQYPDTYVDIYSGCVARGLEWAKAGYVGAITSRSFLASKRLERWRMNQLVQSLELVADLGGEVMDNAMIKSAAWLLRGMGGKSNHVEFLDVRNSSDKSQAILSGFGFSAASSSRISMARADILSLPGARMIYSLPQSFVATFTSSTRFEPDIGTIRKGLTTFDDYRFLRLRWEIPATGIASDGHWQWFGKGGEYANFYTDVHLLVNRASDGAELAEVNRLVNGQVAQSRQASSYYYRPGCQYSGRSQKGFSARAIPSGCVMNSGSPMVLSESPTSVSYLLGWLSSRLVKSLIEMQAIDMGFPPGVLKTLPWIEPNERLRREVEDSALTCFAAYRDFCRLHECDPFFLVPMSPGSSQNSLAGTRSIQGAEFHELREKVVARQSAISSAVDSVYGCDSTEMGEEILERDATIEFTEEELDIDETAARTVTYALGVAFGRWDIRYATGEQAAPVLPDPFAPLPVCPPGQLQSAQGLPARPDDVPTAYPVRIPWDGILVDDPNHPLDLERRVREVIEIIWSGQEGGPTAEAIEHEACEILGVKSLRDYFRKPAGFFADHLKRYSKSRRQAPIYWPLSTTSGSYTLWIYYHRLTDQTLHTVLADFLKPKIKSVEQEISGLRGQGKVGGQIGELQSFLDELLELHEEIERVIKLPWKPNLNDGVLITAAPLWKLFRLGKWQKDLKACWAELEAGDYDWAHLAYTIWPNRVREKCKTDRSLAIAHTLESLCEVKAPEKKAKKSKAKKSQMEMEEAE